MFISFQKSNKPHTVINTNQIIWFVCSISCVELKQEVPAFIIVRKAKHPLLSVLWDKNGVEELVYNEYASLQMSGKVLLYGRNKIVHGIKEFQREGVVVNKDVPCCRLHIRFTGTGGAIEGSAGIEEDFDFHSVEDFIKAIDAIAGATGIQIV